MCIVCVEWNKGSMSATEALRATREMYESGTNAHAEEMLEEFTTARLFEDLTDDED